MPTVEDYFDDETDLPLPSSSKPRVLPNTGHHGALLEEVTSDDEGDMDFSKLTEQGRGVFGENAKAPPPQAVSASANAKGKMTARDEPQGPNPNTPMGGFMGDMMRLQQVEDERMEKLRKQFGNASTADPGVYKKWNTVYPIYFDAKVSIADGRRVGRKSALWWPQATQISYACRSLGLPSVLEPDRCHPADWENPGRVKVQFVKDGKFLNPIVKNRTQLYHHLSAQIINQNPSLVYTPPQKPKAEAKPGPSTKKTRTRTRKSKTPSTAVIAPKLPSRPPHAPHPIPKLDDRLPLHSPVYPAGVALSAIKRDLDNEKEMKKKGLGPAVEGEEKKEKMPKMKRVVVRGKR